MASSVGKHNDGGYNLVVVRDREILDLIAKKKRKKPEAGIRFLARPAVSDLPHEGSGGLSHAV